MRLLAIILCFICSPAFAGSLPLLGAGTQGICPFAGDNGCAAAPANGSVQFSNFFSSRALQSGQSFTTRPPWNVAGVDYAVGAPTTGTFCDVQNGASCAAGALGTGTTAGCAYTATGNPAGGPQVSCTGVHNVVFDHWDFNASGTCTYLTATNTGTMTVTNSKFAWSNTCNLTSLISFSSGNLTGLTFTSNTVDGCPGRDQSVCYQWLTNLQASQFILWNTLKNTPTTLTYNAFFWAPPRFMNIGTSDTGDMNFKYNYLEGLQSPKAKFTATIDNGAGTGVTPGTIMCLSGSPTYGTVANGNTVFAIGMVAGSYALGPPGTACPGGATSWPLLSAPNQAITARTMYVSSSNHGDTIINTMAAAKTRTNYNLVGNTYLSLSTNLANTGAWIVNIAGGGASTITTNTLIDHNTSVDNTSAYSNRAINSAVVYSSPTTMTTTNLTVTNNYAGVTGALFCYNAVFSSAGATLSGNVILENGTSWNAVGLANCVGHGS